MTYRNDDFGGANYFTALVSCSNLALEIPNKCCRRSVLDRYSLIYLIPYVQDRSNNIDGARGTILLWT